MRDIVFRPTSKNAELLADKPKPARSCIPKWFKDIPKFENGVMEIDEGGGANTTMKACMPFLDTFTTGYIQETWCDIYIDTTNPESISWKFPIQPVILRDRLGKNMYPKIEGFSKNELAWQQVWTPKLPDGYSMIYTHPLNRFDLPFLSLTGIIDNDSYYMEDVANHPVFFKEGFKGVIPKGTPMFQMIPMKRDEWQSKFEKYDEDLVVKFSSVKSFFVDGYKKMYWNKKSYN